MSILKVIYKEGIKYIDSEKLEKIIVKNLGWNTFKSEKLTNNLLKNVKIFKDSKQYIGYKELTEESKDILIEAYD